MKKKPPATPEQMTKLIGALNSQLNVFTCKWAAQLERAGLKAGEADGALAEALLDMWSYSAGHSHRQPISDEEAEGYLREDVEEAVGEAMMYVGLLDSAGNTDLTPLVCVPYRPLHLVPRPPAT